MAKLTPEDWILFAHGELWRDDEKITAIAKELEENPEGTGPALLQKITEFAEKGFDLDKLWSRIQPTKVSPLELILCLPPPSAPQAITSETANIRMAFRRLIDPHVGVSRGSAGRADEATEQVWELVPLNIEAIYTSNDEPALTLPPELSQNSYGKSKAVVLRLRGVPDPTLNGLRPQLEVRPAPTVGPLQLELTFATGERRTFVIMPTPTPRPSARSELGEVLPFEAFGMVNDQNELL